MKPCKYGGATLQEGVGSSEHWKENINLGLPTYFFPFSGAIGSRDGVVKDVSALAFSSDGGWVGRTRWRRGRRGVLNPEIQFFALFIVLVCMNVHTDGVV